jgi:hypothetical protein
MIQKVSFNALIPVLIVTFLLLGTVPVQGTCMCARSTADHGTHPRGTWEAPPQPHGCCTGQGLPQFDFDQGCTRDALPYIRAVLLRVEDPLPTTASAPSTESPFYPSVVSSLAGRGFTYPEEASELPDFRNLPLRC